MQIIFTKPRGFSIYGVAIRYGEAFHRFRKTGKWKLNPYCHVAFLYEEPITGRLYIYEADGGIVRMMNPQNFSKRNEISKVYHLPEGVSFKPIDNWLYRKLGKDYAWCQIAGLVKKIIFDITPRYRKNDEFICTEVVLRILRIVGLVTEKENELDFYSVSDCHELVKEVLGEQKNPT